jgi:hypothetical protein
MKVKRAKRRIGLPVIWLFRVRILFDGLIAQKATDYAA